MKDAEAFPKVGLEMIPFAGAHRGQLDEGFRQRWFDGEPCGLDVDLRATRGDDAGLAQEIRGGGGHRVADGPAEFSERLGKGQRQPGIDPEIRSGALGGLDRDRNLNPAAGCHGQHRLADACIQLVQLARRLHHDLRLLAVHRADFHACEPHVRRRRAAAESCHRMHVWSVNGKPGGRE